MTGAARVILLNAVDIPYTASCLMPDNGLAMLAAALCEDGHRVEVQDPASVSTLAEHLTEADRAELGRLHTEVRTGVPVMDRLDELLAVEQRAEEGLVRVYRSIEARLDDSLRAGAVDLLGIKLWLGAGTEQALSMASRLRRRYPRLLVAAGGPLGSMAPEALLNAWPVLDAVCVGEGEDAVVGLARAALGQGRLEAVPNLVIRRGSGLETTVRCLADPANLPEPCYDEEVYPGLATGQQLPILCLSESRGCCMGCPYCAHARMGGDRPRVLTPARVVASMERLHAAHGVRHFRFAGSFTPGTLYRGVARLLLENGSPFRYSGFAHVGGLLERDLPMLRQSGLEALFFGLESGSANQLRQVLGRRVPLARIERLLGASMDAGIFTCGSVIFPTPGETAETEAETRDLLQRLFIGRDNGAVPVIPPLPQPGSRWWDTPEAHGFTLDRSALLAALMRRRVRKLLPPDLYEALPYSLDGQSQARLANRAASLAAWLRRQGILTNLGDDGALMARAAGLSPWAFQQQDHEAFLRGDADRVQGLIRLIRMNR